MALPATTRLYLGDDDCLSHAATVVGVRGEAIAFDRSCFYPGGGGQPADEGTAQLGDAPPLAIVGVHADGDDVVWHVTAAPVAADVGSPALLAIDAPRRRVLARYHTVLHVLNTLARRDHGGWITGAQIGVEYSRIDFRLDGFSPALADELAAKANAVLAGDHRLRAYEVTEEEYRARPELRRTLDAEPPVRDGRVRVVEIDGFDVQACGGTHVHSTAAVGRCVVFRTENKGKNNKRLYVRLE